jgi:2,4-dienoyl-CoA reductase-like NADH-dependent reductase (Old Yellow Enzyme family)
MGRVVHSDFNDGQPPVSASATRVPGHVHTYEGRKDAVEARPLRIDEMPRLLDDYARAAQNAKLAGFDGVQLHAANGYLIDQFLRDSSNLRDDDYGGSPENRVRLLREVMERLIEVWGADRVSVRLSPNGDSQGSTTATRRRCSRWPHRRFRIWVSASSNCASRAGRHLRIDRRAPAGRADPLDLQGPLVLNSDYTPQAAAADVASGRADAISFGRPFISNPDLVERIRKGAPLAPNKGAPETWYFPVPEGYADYPTLAQEVA